MPLDLGVEGLAGDQQANRRVHGGPDKAVCVYSADHAAWWRETLGAPEWGAGAVGENFTVDGQTETSVCLGDIYDVGSARVQVSQPRSPCRTLARRWQRPDLPKRVVQSGRSGWYLRVLRVGRVAVRRLPDAGRATAPATGRLPASTTSATAWCRASTPTDLRALAAVPELAEAWRDGILGA